MQLSATARKYGSSGLIPLSDNMKHKKLVRSSSLLLSSVKQRNPLPNWSKRAKGSSMDGTLLFLGEFFLLRIRITPAPAATATRAAGKAVPPVLGFSVSFVSSIDGSPALVSSSSGKKPFSSSGFLLDPDQRAPVPAAQAAQLRAWSAHLFDLGSRESPE